MSAGNAHVGTAAQACPEPAQRAERSNPAEQGLCGSEATLDTEWSILLAACSAIPSEQKRERLLSLLRQPVRWQKLHALADHHSTQPLLSHALSRVEEAVPAAEVQFLRQGWQTNLHKALLLSRELIRLIEHLSARGIEVMPYKGPALAELLYSDVALRHSGDIDLLIHPEDLPRIRDAVRELGYTPHDHFSAREERSYLKSGYECAFDGAAGPNLLELQWAVLPRFYAVDFDMDGLFRRAATLSVAGQNMRTLSRADYFLVLSLHAAKHTWGRLAWLSDIARLMSLPSLDWEWIGAQATDLGIVRLLQVSMLTANRLLNASIPAAAKRIFRQDGATTALAKKIETHIVGTSAFNVESLAYFRLMMRLRERPADRLRFLARLTFTPGPSEWAAVRLPGFLSPLYRLIRLTRLAAKLLRS
jgi:hypothetical protein